MHFITKKTGVVLSLLLLFSIFITPNVAQAASAKVLNAQANDALKKFYTDVKGAKEIAGHAYGMVIFPSVIKAGLIIGGEYGEGVLRVNGKTVDYYSTAAASFGFQIGAQSKTVMLLFMTKDALTKFRNSDGWEVGVDGSVALIKIGAGGSLDTTNIKAPVLGVVFGNKGLMYNLTLEGTKMSRIRK